MPDGEDQTPVVEPSADGPGPEIAPPEVTADAAPEEDASDPPKHESTKKPAAKTPWVAVGVGAVALLTIVLVALSYALPAPRAALPAAWTVSVPASASSRASAAKTQSGTATPRPSASTPTTPATDAPTAFPTTAGRCTEGQTVSGGTWSVVVPSGWSCAGGTTSGAGQNFQSLVGDAISVGPATAADAITACSSPFGGQAATVERFPDTLWGGRKAVTVNAQFPTLVVQYRCVQTPAGVYMMGGVVRSTAGALVAGMDALAASWVWK